MEQMFAAVGGDPQRLGVVRSLMAEGARAFDSEEMMKIAEMDGEATGAEPTKESDLMQHQRLDIKTTLWRTLVALMDKRQQRTGLHTDPSLQFWKQHLREVVFAVDTGTEAAAARSVAARSAWLDALALHIDAAITDNMHRRLLDGTFSAEWASRIAAALDKRQAEVCGGTEGPWILGLQAKVATASTATCMLAWQWLARLYAQCHNFAILQRIPQGMFRVIRYHAEQFRKKTLAAADGTGEPFTADTAHFMTIAKSILTQCSAKDKAEFFKAAGEDLLPNIVEVLGTMLRSQNMDLGSLLSKGLGRLTQRVVASRQAQGTAAGPPHK